MTRSLTAVALAALLAAPLAGQQDAHQWTNDRPDAIEPVGIRGGRTVETGRLFVDYTLDNERYEGLQLGTDQVSSEFVLAFYDQVPFERKDTWHRVSVGLGATDWLSVLVTGVFGDRARGQIDDDGIFNFYDVSGLSDVQADLLVEVFESETVRGHLNLGVDVPTGSIDEEGVDLTGATTVLPFDTQLGAGSLAFRPGFTARVQNEHATVGTKVEGVFYVDDNDRGYRWGNGVRGSVWMGYMLNSVFSLSAGADYARFADIEGADFELDRLGDPGQDPIFSAGSRVDLPVGMNLLMPAGSPIAGTVLRAEWVFPVHQDYDRPQLRADTRFRISLSRVF